MIPAKHFYMIRHGETEANAQEILAGSMDSPLTDKGRAQAKAVQNIVRSLKTKPKLVIHSQLSRARETAQIINEALGAPMVEDEDFAEIHAGDWEGVPYKECKALLTGWVDAPNGEPYEAFLNRIKMAKIKALENNEPVMIVSHGGVFRALLKLYGIHKEGVRNSTLYEFVPAEKQEEKTFPWDLYRYDIKDDIIRTRVDLDGHPRSEIDL